MSNNISLEKSTVQRSGALMACLCAMALSGIYGWIQNGVMYPQLAEFFPIGREIDSIIRIVLYSLVMVIAHRRPAVFDARILSAIAAISCACAAALLYAAILTRIPLLVVTGLLFFEIGYVWAVIMLGIALCSLKSLKDTVTACAFGMTIGDVASFWLPIPPLMLGMVSMAGIALLTIALTYAAASRFLAGINSDAPADLELANPDAFLKPTHNLFLCILLFSVASGYALTLNEVENAPAQSNLEWIVMLAIACWLVLKKGNEGEDLLFSFSVLLIVAGFLAAPLTFDNGTPGANALIRIGTSSFSILSWLMIASIGRRNPHALLPVLGTFSVMRTAGVLIGAIAGHTVNDWAGLNVHTSGLVTSTVFFAFLAFLWLGFRNFSFEKTIQSVATPVVPRADQEVPIETAAPSIEERCLVIGAQHELTEREKEIFSMLARGRNGSFIQEHYVISRNTVKTHVKRIYKKLDVHSQQELIDLVEKWRASPS